MNFDRKVLWVRYPKTASTTIKAMFIDSDKRWNDNDLKPDIKVAEYKTIHHIFNYKKRCCDLKINKINIIRSLILDEYIQKCYNTWNDTYKIITSRNPYDRFVSGYLHMNIKTPFNEMHEYDYTKLNPKQQNHIIKPIYSEHIKNADYIIRYEYLINDLKKLFELFNMKLNVNNIPVLRKTKSVHYSYYYKKNPHMINFVYNNFISDFEFFKYNKNIN